VPVGVFRILRNRSEGLQCQMNWWFEVLECQMVCCSGIDQSLLVVCMIRNKDSVGTLEHEAHFNTLRCTVYKETLFVVGGFSSLFSLLILLYTTIIDDCVTASTSIKS